MIGTLELFAAGACMGGSMTGFAVNRSNEPASAYAYNLIMMVIGTLAAALAFINQSSAPATLYLGAGALIAGSLAVAALRAFATQQSAMGTYFAGLSAAVAFALSQNLAAHTALSRSADLIT